jgi:hypothetical protein
MYESNYKDLASLRLICYACNRYVVKKYFYMEIQEIKKRLSIIAVLQHYNLEPDRNNHIKCPFHEDGKPSCRVYPETNIFHCFGCSATGNQIAFIEK